MVYNAMKLFMEINPQLFDDCSHEYTEHQNSAASREQARQRKWATVAEQASRRKSINNAGGNASADDDAATEDNQKRLDSLNLDGERGNRHPGMHERQISAGSARSGGR
jgi:serine/threonine-protein phosphatase 2A regulatory subunit B'